VPLIAVDDVSHTYAAQRRPVLHDVTVHLDEHRIGVIGANGSGKSTFARLLNGLVVPDSGTVTVDGHDTRRHGKRVRQLVGFCFTDPDAQIVMPTVAEDVAFSLRRRDLRGRALEGRVADVLARFGLDGHADHPAHLLSGGQKQLLALASVLVTEPALIVLDEPTTLLDLRNAALIADLVAGLDEQVVLLTHHLELLDGFDRVLVFDEGRLVADAAPAEAVELYRRLMRTGG
jgi:biotin transport system ATP-binding protein